MNMLESPIHVAFTQDEFAVFRLIADNFGPVVETFDTTQQVQIRDVLMHFKIMADDNG